MKKNIVLTIILALVSSVALFAIPAKPGKVNYTQPDGSVITIVLHGDEWFHWTTDESGNLLELDENGYYSPASMATADFVRKGIEGAKQRRNEVNAQRIQRASQSLNFGSPKIPVFLIGFSDKSFSKTNAQFSNMLNQEGYSVNSAIGSVKDFYRDNSLGIFTPEFVVLGPVTLSNSMSTYGGNSSGYDKAPYQAVIDAATKLNSSVDFSQFDNDGDGTVDFILFYYAGFDEAQGASSNCIWSHSSELHYYYSDTERTFDGVKFDKYFCTSELIGTSGSTMCNIGTTCHEFGHALGLPDFYDTDYNTNSTPNDMYYYSTMCSGSYNNDSTTPPYFTSEELKILGWYEDQEYIYDNGSITLYPVNRPGATAYHGYRTNTYNENEYFVYEVCTGERWSSGLPTGMWVYHVDKSENKISGGITAASTWDDNTLNAWGVHPCCYLIPAVAQSNLQYGLTYYSSYDQWIFDYNNLVSGGDWNAGLIKNFPFPNTNTNTSYTTYAPKAWDGNTFGYNFTNIAYNSSAKTVTMNVANTNQPAISGKVVDTDGNPLANATVTLSQASREFSESGMSYVYYRPVRNAKAVIATVTTGSDGAYSFTPASFGAYELTAEKTGYVGRTEEMMISTVVTHDIKLMRVGEVPPFSIEPVGGDYGSGYYYYETSSSRIIQNRYRTQEMAQYAGKRINSVSFYLEGDASTSFNGVYAVVDFGNARQATVQMDGNDVVAGGWNTVDLRDENLMVPADQDIYAGCALNNWGYYQTSGSTKYYIFTVYGESVDPNAYDGYTASYNLNSTGTRTKHTSSNYSGGTAFWMYITLGDMPPTTSEYNFIADPQNGSYRAGDVLELSLIETDGVRKPGSAVAWYYDDEPVSGTSVTLTSGAHLIEARFTTTEGKTKVVELEVNVTQ